MAENLAKRPAKGILKTSSSFEQQEAQKHDGAMSFSHQDMIKWDEMNILQTLHPPDKDYGHMKVEEPKTPFSYYKDDVDGEHAGSDHEPEALDADLLAKKIALGREVPPKAMIEEDMDSEEDDENETEEDRAKKSAFEYKRKIHYNEFYAVKLARKLMQQDIEEDIEEDKVVEGKNEQQGTSQTKSEKVNAKKDSVTEPKSPSSGEANIADNAD